MKRLIIITFIFIGLLAITSIPVYAQTCTSGQSYCSTDRTKAYICNNSTLQYQEFDCAAQGYVCVDGTNGTISRCAPSDLEQPATCTPNTAFCDGDVRRICNSSGNASVGAGVDCAAQGRRCVESSGSANCVALTPQECYQNCLATPGNTPIECRAGCGMLGPSTGGGDTGGGIVDLNALIGSIGGRIPQLTTPGTILSALLPILYGLSGIGLLIFLVYSGFSYLTSSGDPKKMEAAKGQITAAVLGFILIIAAFWVTQIVNYVFGLGSGF